jgi:hypothetical protein
LKKWKKKEEREVGPRGGMCLAVPSLQVDKGYIKGLNVAFEFAKGMMEERAR